MQNNKNRDGKRRGFTLIELIVVIGIISILSSAVIIAVNPARQFKLARDSKRTTDVNTILNAIDQNMAEHNGIFYCNGSPLTIPTSEKSIGDSNTGGWDMYACTVPDYISQMPIDPNNEGAYFNSPSDYNTQYTIMQDALGRVTISGTSEVDPSKKITTTR